MSREIVDLADADDALGLKRAFDDAMVSKLAAAIEIRKQELGSQVFGDENEELENEEEEVEYEDDETD